MLRYSPLTRSRNRIRGAGGPDFAASWALSHIGDSSTLRSTKRLSRPPIRPLKNITRQPNSLNESPG